MDFSVIFERINMLNVTADLLKEKKKKLSNSGGSFLQNKAQICQKEKKP